MVHPTSDALLEWHDRHVAERHVTFVSNVEFSQEVACCILSAAPQWKDNLEVEQRGNQWCCFRDRDQLV